MSARILTIEEVVEKYQISKSWIYKRTGPNAKRYPKLPVLSGFGRHRFDELELDAVFSQPCSLKTKAVRKSIATKFSGRRLERLW